MRLGGELMFGPRTDEKRSQAMRRLKQLARELFEAADDDAVVVNELSCTEPGCPPIETIVALLRAGGEPRQVKVHKPAVDVTEDDLRHAMLHGHAHGHAKGS
jgi:hypothetical protein